MTKSEQKTYDLKSAFNAEVVNWMSQLVARSTPDFNSAIFVQQANDGLERLELKARSAQISDALARALPADYESAITTVLRAVGPLYTDPRMEDVSSDQYGFRYMPFLDFVERYGMAHPKMSLDAMEHLTSFFSAEFAVRPYFLADPETVLARFDLWSKSPNWHVRRLASEGSRPRLPWGMVLRPLVQDPTPMCEVLKRLHDDPELAVRRSVANHLNDIAKDHPDIAVAWARDWWATETETARWTVRHGLRTLIKNGNPEALSILGFVGGEDAKLDNWQQYPSNPIIRDKLRFTFEIRPAAGRKLKSVIDYALVRPLPSGKTARKVFKVGIADLAVGEVGEFSVSLSLRQMTTRTYVPGHHRISVLSNGHEIADFGFELRSA